MRFAFKRIDLNQFFLSLGIFHGPYDGQRITCRPFFRLYSKFVWWFSLFHVFKFGSLLFVDKHDYLAFVFADYFNNESKNVHKFMSMVSVTFTSWSFSSVWRYQRVNYDTRDAYWLKMLPFNQPEQSSAVRKKSFEKRTMQTSGQE